jgi:hypothetical protein
MPFAVLHFDGDSSYDFSGVPEELVTRLEAAKQNKYRAGLKRHDIRVPIYEMLDWIEASGCGWTLHSAAAGSQHSQLYVFHA